MAVPVLSCHHLRKIYLEREILSDVSFSVQEGERIALLGANGAGKSTLLGILAGSTPSDGGEVRRRRDLTVAYLGQEGGLRDDYTVGEEIDRAFARLREVQAELDGLHSDLEKGLTAAEQERALTRCGELQEVLDKAEVHTLEARKSEAMNALGVAESSRRIGELSGGERRRVALCRTLLENPELLLLDEPTNHLDAETLDWLEDFVNGYSGTVILITHDRYFLDRVATKMIEVARGEATVYQGNYSDYMEAKAQEEALTMRAEETRRNLLRRELEWLRRQPKARTTKSQARIDRAHDLMNSQAQPPDPNMKMILPNGPRLGNTLIEAKGVWFSRGGRELIRDFTFTLGKGDRIGVVGRNGLGKTTLLQLLMKTLTPDRGTVHIGETVKFVYADQRRENLDPEKTVLQEVAGEYEYVTVGGERIGFRSWLSRFLFDENTAAMPIRLLSGGEQNRVQMAKLLREGGNVVVLDEPTNDLDLPTLRVLEEALVRFDGCAFIVSHDRYFLNRVANRIIGFRGEGEVCLVEGNYDHYRLFLEKTEDAEPMETPPAPREKKPEPSPRKPREQKKLTFNEKREFESLEDKILEMETRVGELNRELQDPDCYTKHGGEGMARMSAELETAKAEVERLYDRWAELSERA